MSLAFQKLMKQAAAQTQTSQREAADLLAQQRKARSEQEARDAKAREERKAQVAFELERKRRELEIAEDEARRRAKRDQERAERPNEKAWAVDLLNKGKSRPPVGSSPARAGGNKGPRLIKERSDDSRSSSPRPNHNAALSREEKRALANPLLREEREYNRAKALNGGYPAPARRRANGTHSPLPTGVRASGNRTFTSTRERILATPGQLIALNTVKKDTRTIDEITRDLEAKRNGTGSGGKKELVGEEAAAFTDWFGKERKKEQLLQQRQRALAAASPSAPSTSTSSAATSKPANIKPPPKPSAAMNGNGNAHGPVKPLPSSRHAEPHQPPFPSAKPGARTSTGVTLTRQPGLSSLPPPRSERDRPSVPMKRPHEPSRPSSSSNHNANPYPSSSANTRPPASRAPAAWDEYDSEIEEEEEEEEQEAGSTSFRYVPGTIAALLGRDIKRDAARERELSPSSSDGSDSGGARKKRRTKGASYGYEELMREERRSAMLARKEDEAEERRLKEHEMRKAERKRRAAAAAAAGGGGSGRSD